MRRIGQCALILFATVLLSGWIGRTEPKCRGSRDYKPRHLPNNHGHERVWRDVPRDTTGTCILSLQTWMNWAVGGEHNDFSVSPPRLESR